MKIEKPWGWEKIIENNGNYVVKKLFMKKGCQCSLQYHNEKIETIVVLDGTLTIVWDANKKTFLKPFDVITIYNGTVHRMASIQGDCLYLECSTNELDDVVRLEDSYGRV